MLIFMQKFGNIKLHENLFIQMDSYVWHDFCNAYKFWINSLEYKLVI
jgi:hypothetical protein